MMNDIELKPCPFCGGNPTVQSGFHNFHDVEIVCEKCAASGGNYDCDDEKEGQAVRNLVDATAAWNRRIQR